MGWKLALPTFEFSSTCEWVVWGPRKQKDDLRREDRVFGVLFHWLSCFGEGTVAPVGRVSRPPLQDSMSKETWEGWLRLAALYTSAGLQQSPLKKKRNWWNSWSLSNTGTFTLCQKTMWSDGAERKPSTKPQDETGTAAALPTKNSIYTTKLNLFFFLASP